MMTSRSTDNRLRILITEDDFTSRRIMSAYLNEVGNCDVAVDGQEAVNGVQSALEAGKPYDIIFLDILMPNMDGHQALRAIREVEEEFGISGKQHSHVIMTTSLHDPANVLRAFNGDCEAYMVKPITRTKLRQTLAELGFIDDADDLGAAVG